METTDNIRHLQVSERWRSFVEPDWLTSIMSVEVTDLEHRKQGRAIARWTLRNEQNEQLVVFLKRHFQLSWWSTLLARFFPRGRWSPATQEAAHLAWAQSLGLPVPTVHAVGEMITTSGLQSFLAVEELTGMLPLHLAIPRAEAQLSLADFRRWKLGLTEELARLTCELHRRAYFHKDLYLCHFYLAETACHHLPASWQNLVWMIDFHRLGSASILFRWFQIKDLAQLLFSTEGVSGIENRDRWYFWNHYQDKIGARYSRGYRKLIVRKARLYSRHNQK